MARDRKRAKQRQQRRSAARSSAGRASERDERASERDERASERDERASERDERPPQAAHGDGPAEGAPASHLTRADLPGALDHMGDVDEFDAALVRGADGVPLTPGALPGEADALPEDSEDSEDSSPPAPPADGAPANGASSVPVRVRPSARTPERQRLPARALAFLRASWAELQRVQWPNRAQVTQATAVVLGFVAVAGLYFGLADYIAKEVVEAIL